MSDMLVFTVYDHKAEAYLPPFTMKTLGLATRTFAELANDKGHNFGKYPTDFSLWQIGTFSEDSGVITPLAPFRSLGTAVEFLDAEPAAEAVADLRELKVGGTN